MDISTLFGKSFASQHGVTVVVHDTTRENGEFVGTVVRLGEISTRRMREIISNVVHLYPFNPAVLKNAQRNGYCAIGVWKEGRDHERDYPSLVCYFNPPEDRYLEGLVEEDISVAFRDLPLEVETIYS